jgi:transcriptional regulator with XRE-family HTH domain
MRLLDDFLKENGVSRYQVSKVSGISSGRLSELASKDLEHFSYKHLQAIGITIGKSAWEVLRDLEEINQDELNGFVKFLNKYNAREPLLEHELKQLLDWFKDNNIKVKNFSFNRFEEEKHTDISKDAKITLQNAISSLSKVKQKALSGNPPTIR